MLSLKLTHLRLTCSHARPLRVLRHNDFKPPGVPPECDLSTLDIGSGLVGGRREIVPETFVNNQCEKEQSDLCFIIILCTAPFRVDVKIYIHIYIYI